MDFKSACEPGAGQFLGSRRLRPTVVIADRGNSACRVVLDPSITPEIGTRFRHSGLTWVITRVRDLERTYVAEPVSH